MKKIFLTAALAVMAATGANAQGFEWGAKAGVNLAWQTEVSSAPGDPGKLDDGFRTGFYAGVFAERVFNYWLGVQAELLYSQTGMKAKTSLSSYGNKLDYLVLPVLAKFHVWKGLTVDLGPQFGYMLSAKDGDGNKYDSERLKRSEVSVAAGLSYKIAGGFDVSARLNVGLTKPFEPDDKKNRAFSLGVGYRF